MNDTFDILAHGPQLATATSANEAAVMAFPDIAGHCCAFYEQQAPVTQTPSIEIFDLNDTFWAMSIGPLGSPQRPIFYVIPEKQFRRYNSTTGIYEPIPESAVMGQIIDRLDFASEFFPAIVKRAIFHALKNRQRLRSVVDRARDLLAVDDGFFMDKKRLHLSLQNGILQLDTGKFTPSKPTNPVRETLPVNYAPDAQCDLFLHSFLGRVLEQVDIDLLQRSLSQVLEGINHSQTLVVLNGVSGFGKSSIMKIIGTLVGWDRVGVIRDQLYQDDYELAHYDGKHLLFHPDMPTEFLDHKNAAIFKQLCGGDPIWSNLKSNDSRKVIQGNFPIVLATNGTPKIRLDDDYDAWLRRLIVITFKAPVDEQHWGKMADIILKSELSGILNWLLEGRKKLAKDKFQLTMTPEQRARTVNLLTASDSPAAFVKANLVKKEGSDLGMTELYERYAKWCRDNHIRAYPSKKFSSIAIEEIEIGLGIRYRHDLVNSAGRQMRGWKALGFVESNPGNVENASCGSADENP